VQISCGVNLTKLTVSSSYTLASTHFSPFRGKDKFTPLHHWPINQTAQLVVATTNLKVSLRRYITGRLTKPPSDVVFGLFMLGVGEDAAGVAKLDQISQIHIRREIGYSRCLLHVVGDDDDGEICFQFVN